MKKLYDEIPFLESEYIVIKKMEDGDAEVLERMTKSERVRRYLPTFLYEQNNADIHEVIRQFYDSCFAEKNGIFLGIYWKEDDRRDFCGILELYEFRDNIQHVSIGCRLAEEYWGKEIAAQATSMIVDYLYNETDIEIITASSMIENQASANVLKKCGFTLVNSGVEEDWGLEKPVLVDKWIR